MVEIETTWMGPYSWPGYEQENGLRSLPKQPGLYLQTVEYQNGFLVYAAGLTRRTIPQRFREHTRKYMSGDYNVLDIVAMQQGTRREIWHGWGWSPMKRERFEEQKTLVLDAVQKQLASFRIFVTDIGTEPRLLERLESAIMNNLYNQPAPLCDVPDKGMMLAPRRNSESLIIINNEFPALLYGLPLQFEM